MPKAAPRPPVSPSTPVNTGETKRALPLPSRSEPLTLPMRHAPQDTSPLPRNRALTATGGGLLVALNGWLRATGQKLLRGFMVKQPGRRPAPPPLPLSMRERVELTQLRAENRRLRDRIDTQTEPRDQIASEASDGPAPEAVSPRSDAQRVP